MFGVVLYTDTNSGSLVYTAHFPWHASGGCMDKPVRISLFVSVIFCSRFVNHAYLSTSLLALKFKKCIAIGLRTPGMHATRWLASGLIAFLKRLADFMKKMTSCTIPAWTKCSFLRRNTKLVILIKHPKSCIGHWKYEEAMIWSLNRNSWVFVKFRKSTLRTDSWESLEKTRRRGAGLRLGATK